MSHKNGRCGCGKISYTLSADILSIINCHCNTCRVYNGAAFTSYVIVPADSLLVDDSVELFARYKKDKSTKNFCSHCGTPLFNTHDDFPSIKLVYLGTIIGNTTLIPNTNTWCENQLSWVADISTIESVEHGS